MTGNKRRVYMAFYPGGNSSSEGVPFHTALLVTPKNPDVGSQQDDSWRFHIGTIGQHVWGYKPETTRARSLRLGYVVLVGKLEPEIDIDNVQELLAGVPIVQGDPNWRSRHWVWAAVQSLIDNKIIKKLPNGPEAAWNQGYDYAMANPFDIGKPIPTLDATGKELSSELPSIYGY